MGVHLRCIREPSPPLSPLLSPPSPLPSQSRV